MRMNSPTLIHSSPIFLLSFSLLPPPPPFLNALDVGSVSSRSGWWPLELENQDHGSISPPSRIGRWGESSQEMAQRIGDTFESILQWQQDHLPRDQSAFSSPSPSSSTSYQIKTIIVTHACGVQALVGRADGISPSGWGSTIMPDNCSLTLLESEGRDESEGREMWRVVKRARTSHLMG